MRHRNHIRAEVNRLPWPEIIREDESDREREIANLNRRLRAWRAFALFLLVELVLVVLIVVVMPHA
jgi:predicted nucleic acid-binding Zn ribbon protein